MWIVSLCISLSRHNPNNMHANVNHVNGPTNSRLTYSIYIVKTAPETSHVIMAGRGRFLIGLRFIVQSWELFLINMDFNMEYFLKKGPR